MLCAIGLAVVTSYGLSSAMDIMYTTLHSSLPFLVLGLGADDAFVIVGEFQHQMSVNPKGTKEDHLIQTMRHAGVSILITSLTDFLAFSVGSTTGKSACRVFF